jgi:hypothetical protein
VRLFLSNGFTQAAASNPITVANINPTPALTSLTPTSVVAGSAGFTLRVTGTGLVSGATATVGGTARPVTFVGGTQLGNACFGQVDGDEIGWHRPRSHQLETAAGIGLDPDRGRQPDRNARTRAAHGGDDRVADRRIQRLRAVGGARMDVKRRGAGRHGPGRVTRDLVG